jgi:predicted nucleic acid-binding protein
LVVSPVVYAEVSAAFSDAQELEDFLQDFAIAFSPMSREASHLAGRLYFDYRRLGGEKARILPDFLIAGHAFLQADQLLTRDRGFYRKYFRGLKVVEP